MPSKEFLDLMQQSIAIHEKKSHDYASEQNPFQNFDYQVIIMGWFKEDADKVFAGIIAQKLARLAELSNGKTPKNEAIEDTELDLITYMGLWMAYRRRKKDDSSLKEALRQVDERHDIFLEHRCYKCNKTFIDMHLYSTHAQAMHSAIYDPLEGSILFNDFKEILPSLKFPKDEDIPF